MTAKTHLVLVPGLLCTGALWGPQIEALSDLADITVADHTRHDSMAGIARSILDRAPERFALAGLSMGGYISHEIMRLAPERVLKLALLDTGSRADPPEKSQGRRELIAATERDGIRHAPKALMPLLVHSSRLSDQPLIDLIIQMAEDTGLEAFKRQQTAIMTRPDNRPGLANINCPTLVLVGREDVLTPLELSQEMASGIPDARLEIIPECGHMSTLERPEAVNRALRDWMKE